MSEVRCRDSLRPEIGFGGAFAATHPNMVAKVFDLLMTWQRRADERRHLMQLDDRLLADMGLSRADVEHEYRTPFWR